MPLDKESQAKLQALLEAQSISEPTEFSAVKQEEIRKHVHNNICSTYPDEFRIFTGSCGYDNNLKWNELKNTAVHYRGDKCLVCNSSVRTVYPLIARTKISQANPEYDLLPICDQHILLLEEEWLEHIKLAGHKEKQTDFFQHKATFIYPLIARLKETAEIAEVVSSLEEKFELEKTKYEELFSKYSKEIISHSPIALASDLRLDITELLKRSVFLNLSWQEDVKNLDHLDYTRLRLSLTNVKEIHYLEYPDLQTCVVCNNWLTDYNVVNDRFDSYVCAGLSPNWDINTVPDGAFKCWQNAKGHRLWKDSYPTLNVAKDYMIMIAEEHGENPKTYSAYKCSNCYRYHFGHGKGYKRV